MGIRSTDIVKAGSVLVAGNVSLRQDAVWGDPRRMAELDAMWDLHLQEQAAIEIERGFVAERLSRYEGA